MSVAESWDVSRVGIFVKCCGSSVERRFRFYMQCIDYGFWKYSYIYMLALLDGEKETSFLLLISKQDKSIIEISREKIVFNSCSEILHYEMWQFWDRIFLGITQWKLILIVHKWNIIDNMSILRKFFPNFWPDLSISAKFICVNSLVKFYPN